MESFAYAYKKMEAKDGRRRSCYEQQRRHDDGDDANLDRLRHMLQLLVPISLSLMAAATVSPQLAVVARDDDVRPMVPHGDLAADQPGADP